VTDINHITGRQIAAGRTLLNMSQSALAEAARISVPTLGRMEASEGAVTGFPNNIAAVVAALERAGVVFLDEDSGGRGVRLRKPKRRGKL
jgi:transcriptional regulator with XRE-family HTH domain